MTVSVNVNIYIHIYIYDQIYEAYSIEAVKCEFQI